MRIENGVYIGKIMHAIRKTKIKLSRKPFGLDPGLTNLKDQSTKQVREYNWNLIISQLLKFNIKVSVENKSQIIINKSQKEINDILSKLKEYDENMKILGTDKKIRNDNGYRLPDELPLPANSEINYGYRDGSYTPLEKLKFNQESDSQQQNNRYG